MSGLKVKPSLFPVRKHLFDTTTLRIQFQHFFSLESVADDKQKLTTSVFPSDVFPTEEDLLPMNAEPAGFELFRGQFPAVFLNR